MRVTEKRKKEIGDKGLKKERKKERKVMGLLVYSYSGRCVRHERKGRRREKATRCCSKVPLLREREKREVERRMERRGRRRPEAMRCCRRRPFLRERESGEWRMENGEWRM